VAGPASVAFRVRTAPWMTWPAMLGYAALAVGLVYGAVRARLRALAEQNRRLEDRVQERTRELDHKNVELGQRVAELDRKNQELSASHARADRIFSALADVLPGTELDGKYRLAERIGSGGFGAVFRARHLALERDVAVKVFRPAPGNDSAVGLARFQREGASASLVSHPNAVQVFDAGVSPEGIVYLVMELLVGRSLAEELRIAGPLPLGRAARVTVEMCGALAAAHARGLEHRDIKPDNIFLHQGRDGETVKVVDFGIAKQSGLEGSGDLQETRGLVGTPSYMAPERLQGEAGGARADVYSAGVTVYEMLAGTLPYPIGERSLLEQMMRQLADPPVPLRSVAPHVPEAVADVVMRCLSRDPAERPGIEALAEALASVPEADRDAAPATRPKGAPAVDALGLTVDTNPITEAITSRD
jgi:serine/threonine protein kinase